jgi:hypothetical protein
MRPFLSSMALLAIFLAVPLYAADKDDKPAADKDKPPQEKIVALGTLTGVVQSVDGQAGELTLRVTFRYLEPNVPAQENYVRRVQQLLVRQQGILLNPNPVQVQQQLAQIVRDAENLMQSQKDLFHIKSVDKDVALELAEDVKVRSAQPLEQFDDKGNIKRYTVKELRELKGGSKLPGFQAAVSDLQPGQSTIVRVVRRQLPKGAGAPVKKAEKPAAGDSQSAPATIRLITPDHRIFVTVVMIVGDPMK